MTGSQASDSPRLPGLIAGVETAAVLADKGYDSDHFRAVIEAAGAEAVVPTLGSRKAAIPYDKRLYKERNLVERFFNKIKHFRRIATRYEKTALSFAAMLSLVGAVIWLR